MPYIIIAIEIATTDFYPIRSFGFETYTACHIFIVEIIVAPELGMIYGCFNIDN